MLFINAVALILIIVEVFIRNLIRSEKSMMTTLPALDAINAVNVNILFLLHSLVLIKRKEGNKNEHREKENHNTKKN